MSVFLRIVFAIVYTLGYLVVVFFTIGAGEGTFAFAAGLLTWPLIFVCVVLLSKLDKPSARKAFVTLLTIHYIVSFGLACFIEGQDQFYYTWRYIRYNPEFFVACVLWYLGGQVILWLAFFWQIGSKNRGALPLVS